MKELDTEKRAQELQDLDIRKDIKQIKKSYLGIVIAIGVAVGAAIENIALGIGMGVAVAAIMYFFQSLKKE